MKSSFKKYMILSMLLTVSFSACSLSGNSTNQGRNSAEAIETLKDKPAQVDTVTIESEYIQSPAKFVVALPASALEEGCEREYPTVYLLHGYDGKYSDWASHTDLAQLADAYDCIIVCPDGRDSWYFDSPVDSKMQMESFITKELVKYVDDNYPTLIERESRAITGLSMGGHGAMWIGLNHPDLFAAIGSMSGALDVLDIADKYNTANILGKYAQNINSWNKHSLIKFVQTVDPATAPAIIFDCGSEDLFIKVNKKMDRVLTDKGIEHNFSSRPGKHSWKYWTVSLPKHLEYFRSVFDKAEDDRKD